MPDDERQRNLAAIMSSSSYVLAEQDTRMLAQRELRPVRLQLEFLKPELGLHEHNIESTIVVFGSTRIIERPAAEARLTAAQQLPGGRSQDAAAAPPCRVPSGCSTSAAFMTTPASLPGWCRAAASSVSPSNM